MILHKRLDDGAFVAGDTVSGRTCYAYPTSEHARKARRGASAVAEKMMVAENALGAWRDQNAKDYDARNWARLRPQTLD
jgi:hypothetical protein